MTSIKRKRCPKCKELLSETAFSRRTKNGTTLASWCKMCNKDNKARMRELVKRQCLEYKGGAKCALCGYSKFIGALDFHHLDPTQKEFGFAKLTKFNGRVKKELDKCIVLCANCHREVEGRFEG